MQSFINWWWRRWWGCQHGQSTIVQSLHYELHYNKFEMESSILFIYIAYMPLVYFELSLQYIENHHPSSTCNGRSQVNTKNSNALAGSEVSASLLLPAAGTILYHAVFFSVRYIVMLQSFMFAWSQQNYYVLVAWYVGPKKFTLSELKNATHNFSEENLIGKGGFCTVYRVLVCLVHHFIISKWSL